MCLNRSWAHDGTCLQMDPTIWKQEMLADVYFLSKDIYLYLWLMLRLSFMLEQSINPPDCVIIEKTDNLHTWTLP